MYMLKSGGSAQKGMPQATKAAGSAGAPRLRQGASPGNPGSRRNRASCTCSRIRPAFSSIRPLAAPSGHRPRPLHVQLPEDTDPQRAATLEGTDSVRFFSGMRLQESGTCP
jgi:hypothetical protein